ncbi:hypothetical protein [Niabella drilacis]|uniref:PH domain-containing protein n=1 Tax=Niabella drilacis (strain DSM 25811 / CCM 8410 / CCUG 62505 / LMG 26954 / E90) TaxID=1285928 RepID=A0A1G6LZI5_NIADE|nr:hypothetical protein [Niabella drilacis]SDC48106.1 hypothetical protein SAMN04487894_102494 [Niabella drilacis]
MQSFKHFTADGNVYKMKHSYFLPIALILILPFFSYFIFREGKYPLIGWLLLALAILGFSGLISRSLVIDLNALEIRAKTALLRPAVCIPLDHFQSFELHQLKQGFFTTNTSLNICYLKDGKTKRALIAQGITTRAMQHILNEIDEIISNYDSPR